MEPLVAFFQVACDSVQYLFIRFSLMLIGPVDAEFWSIYKRRFATSISLADKIIDDIALKSNLIRDLLMY